MKRKLYIIIAFVCCMFAAKLRAQSLDYISTKEKIYIHTNHVFFKPGEQLFYKLYLVNARDQTPSLQSSVAYVEVINPAGNIVQKSNYKIVNGYTEGSYDFAEQAVGGIYKLRAYTAWMQNEKDSLYFSKEITVQKVIAPRVFMKLDFPKKGYGAGDEVSADYSIRNLDDQPIKNYEAKYTVSIAGTVLQVGTFKTNTAGKAQVRFNLPNDLKSNDGLLNITIQYDSYTEAISRSIPIVLNKIDVQFMPESGTLVAGIQSQIAFRAVNENGKPTDIKGEIWDDLGTKVSDFESFHFGMGKFAFMPKPDRQYTAKITSPTNILQQYVLPKAAPKGVVMSINKKDNKIHIQIQSTNNLHVKLIGQTKSLIYYTKTLSLEKGSETLEINAQNFPAGIAQFTLYNIDNVPLAERLVFLNENKVLQVKISPDKQKYMPREKVVLRIETTDESGKPVPSNLSLSVVDDKLWSFADDKQDHILSWLLLGSELSGKIEEPQFYFKKEEAKALPALDLVMLTHGYRYFDYISFVQEDGHVKFMPDQDQILSGVVTNEKGLAVKSKVYLIDTYGSNRAIETETSEDGMFLFSGISPYTYYQVIARSEASKEKVVIQILKNGFMPALGKNAIPSIFSVNKKPVPEIFGIPAVKKEAPVVADKLAEPKMKDEGLFAKRAANLDEVVVTGYGVDRRRSVTGAISFINAKDIVTQGNINNLLNGRVAGLTVTQFANPGAASQMRIRGTSSLTGNNEPLMVLNGIPMDKFDVNMSPGDISSITVLKDAAGTAIYGSRAANGAIMIETKNSRNERIDINFTKTYYYASQLVRSSGTDYSVAKRFYAPKYSTVETTERSDFRENIYWNPTVQTDKDGLASVSFYNADATTTYRVLAEGIGYNGKIGRLESTYTVQAAMAIDAKIPPYLTVGDKALLPFVIKNNQAENISVDLNLQLPKNIKAGLYAKRIDLEPNASKQVLIPIEAIAAAKGDIRFVLSGQSGTETLTLPIVANDKGFPVIETFSGNSSAAHQFTVNKMIPGSLHANLKLLSTLEGQLLDGIESMLREPYGCFEQTSSSTYPNIFVLKYLKEAGKSNPDIEKKALKYIEAGYKRLVGFETSQNGFEWFGHAPAHEALTAYGLLEFTDMQAFIDVDQKMMARTKKFLMDRRDGKGSFKLASGGYDRFASVPNNIANIYIVYALSQAGVGKEIELEYDTAVAKAIAANDGYQMAMMALAANSMNREKDYTKLMELLNAKYFKDKLASQTSVVNSRDASLRVEALSLYTLALARQKQPPVALMAQLISKILGEKSYYGYGSTQATVMALGAVVAYSKIIGKVDQQSKVEFSLNQNLVLPQNSNLGIKDGSNSFVVKYVDEKQSIPYNMEVSYNTFTPPNSAKAELKLFTGLKSQHTKVGETVRMELEITNMKNMLQPMAIAKIGIPAGLSIQPWQLKEIMEKNQVTYYEIFDNYLVLYWMGFGINETKHINLDLKAEIPGTYTAKSSNAYLYYTPEYKNWNDGVTIEILP